MRITRLSFASLQWACIQGSFVTTFDLNAHLSLWSRVALSCLPTDSSARILVISPFHTQWSSIVLRASNLELVLIATPTSSRLSSWTQWWSPSTWAVSGSSRSIVLAQAPVLFPPARLWTPAFVSLVGLVDFRLHVKCYMHSLPCQCIWMSGKLILLKICE